jgi:hypothetical protein
MAAAAVRTGTVSRTPSPLPHPQERAPMGRQTRTVDINAPTIKVDDKKNVDPAASPHGDVKEPKDFKGRVTVEQVQAGIASDYDGKNPSEPKWTQRHYDAIKNLTIDKLDSANKLCLRTVLTIPKSIENVVGVLENFDNSHTWMSCVPGGSRQLGSDIVSEDSNSRSRYTATYVDRMSIERLTLAFTTVTWRPGNKDTVGGFEICTRHASPVEVRAHLNQTKDRNPKYSEDDHWFDEVLPSSWFPPRSARKRSEVERVKDFSNHIRLIPEGEGACQLEMVMKVDIGGAAGAAGKKLPSSTTDGIGLKDSKESMEKFLTEALSSDIYKESIARVKARYPWRSRFSYGGSPQVDAKSVPSASPDAKVPGDSSGDKESREDEKRKQKESDMAAAAARRTAQQTPITSQAPQTLQPATPPAGDLPVPMLLQSQSSYVPPQSSQSQGGSRKPVSLNNGDRKLVNLTGSETDVASQGHYDRFEHQRLSPSNQIQYLPESGSGSDGLGIESIRETRRSKKLRNSAPVPQKPKETLRIQVQTAIPGSQFHSRGSDDPFYSHSDRTRGIALPKHRRTNNTDTKNFVRYPSQPQLEPSDAYSPINHTLEEIRVNSADSVRIGRETRALVKAIDTKADATSISLDIGIRKANLDTKRTLALENAEKKAESYKSNLRWAGFWSLVSIPAGLFLGFFAAAPAGAAAFFFKRAADAKIARNKANALVNALDAQIVKNNAARDLVQKFLSDKTGTEVLDPAAITLAETPDKAPTRTKSWWKRITGKQRLAVSIHGEVLKTPAAA